MNVIQMSFEILIILYEMLPKSSLPDGCFLTFLTGFISLCARSDVNQVVFCEKAFDFFPTDRIISIILGKFPDTM